MLQTPQITTISETTTCFYEIQIASDRFCGDKTFPVLLGESPMARGGGAASGPLDTGSEDWFVEMVELEGSGGDDDGKAEPVLMCQAYSLEYRATSVTNLHFSRFDLRVTKLQGSSATNRRDVTQLPRQYQRFTARQPGRVDIEASYLRAGYGQLALDEDSDYDGSLSFLKIYA